MRPSHKQVGCCTLCGKEVFEVHARFPNDHPLAGEVRGIGRPLLSARRVTLILMSGASARVTVCNACPVDPQSLPGLWTVCMKANAQDLEDERREATGASGLSESQRRDCTETLRGMVVDLPIAVLAAYPWEEDDVFAVRSR